MRVDKEIQLAQGLIAFAMKVLLSQRMHFPGIAGPQQFLPRQVARAGVIANSRSSWLRTANALPALTGTA